MRQQQQFHTDDVKSVRNLVRSSDWWMQYYMYIVLAMFMNDREKTKGHKTGSVCGIYSSVDEAFIKVICWIFTEEHKILPKSTRRNLK